MQTIKITITSSNPANVHIKECKPTPTESVNEKLVDVIKKMSLTNECEELGGMLDEPKY